MQHWFEWLNWGHGSYGIDGFIQINWSDGTNWTQCVRIDRAARYVWFHWMILLERMKCKHIEFMELTICIVGGTEIGARIYNTKKRRNRAAFTNSIKSRKMKGKDDKKIPFRLPPSAFCLCPADPRSERTIGIIRQSFLCSPIKSGQASFWLQTVGGWMWWSRRGWIRRRTRGTRPASSPSSSSSGWTPSWHLATTGTLTWKIFLGRVKKMIQRYLFHLHW